MFDPQYSYYVISRIIAIHGDVTRMTVGNNQLAPKGVTLAPDQRMIRKYQNRGLNTRDDLVNRRGRCVEQKFDDALEIGERFIGINYLRQALARGRVAFCPWARLVR